MVEKNVVIEVQTTKTQSLMDRYMEKNDESRADVVAYSAVYNDDENTDRMSLVLDSPVSKILNLALNPIALISVLYIVILGGNKISNLFNTIFVKLG